MNISNLALHRSWQIRGKFTYVSIKFGMAHFFTSKEPLPIKYIGLGIYEAVLRAFLNHSSPKYIGVCLGGGGL